MGGVPPHTGVLFEHRLSAPALPSQALQHGQLPERYALGLARTRWPGRAQVVPDAQTAHASADAAAEPVADNLTFFLDGAHTGESATTCAEWFLGATAPAAGALSDDSIRVLVFNCMKARMPPM